MRNRPKPLKNPPVDDAGRELVDNPAVSEQQRKYLNAKFGHDWVKEHHFDNEGKLPERVKPTKNILSKRKPRKSRVVWLDVSDLRTPAGYTVDGAIHDPASVAPVFVAKRVDNAGYMVIDGVKRVAAMRNGGVHKLRAIVSKHPYNDQHVSHTSVTLRDTTTTNAPRTKRHFNPLRHDPTRTLALRSQFSLRLKGMFDVLRQRIDKWLVTDDSLGLGRDRPSSSPPENNDDKVSGVSSPSSILGNRQEQGREGRGGSIVNAMGIYDSRGDGGSVWNINRSLHGHYQPFLTVNRMVREPEYRLGWFPTNNLHIVEVPDVRQRDHYSCGAACAASVGGYFGVGPKTLEDWKIKLGTDVEESTRPQAIADYFCELGLQVEVRGIAPTSGYKTCMVVSDSPTENRVDLGRPMTVEDLRSYTERGYVVITPIQDYGPRVSSKARYAYGHYVVVIGVSEGSSGYVFCQDPSEDNVIAGGDSTELWKTGSVQKPGRIMIGKDDFDRAWHDTDIDGNKYDHFGIAVGPPVVKSPTTVTNSSSQDIDAAAAEADPNPSEAAIEAGNYRKGHVTIQGLPITIETAAGNKRKPWHDKPLAVHYGYLKAQKGVQTSEADGDHVDVFIGPDPESDQVWIVDQYKVGTENSNPNHDEKGRFTGILDLAKITLSKRDPLSGMGSPDVKKCLAELEDTLSSLPAAAHQEASKNIKSVHFGVSPSRLAKVFEREMGRSISGDDAEVGGVMTKEGKLFLGGKVGHGVYAHELGHAIDPDNVHSHSKEWLEAWSKEISYPDKSPMSELARISPSEGFAEFARASWTGHVGDVGAIVVSKRTTTSRELKEKFPLMSAYFDKNKFTPSQTTNASTFDEHKCLIAFPDRDSAIAAYRDSYPDDWQGMGDVTEMSMDEFKQWLRTGDTSRPVAEAQLVANKLRMVLNEYDPNQPRDDRGRFGSGEHTLEGVMRPAAERAVHLAQKSVSVYQRRMDQLDQDVKDGKIPPSVGQLAKKAKDVMTAVVGGVKSRLEDRYGKKTALAIMGSGQALAWGATGVGAVMGVPVWLPLSSVWGVIPGAAVAEAFLQAHRGLRRVGVINAFIPDQLRDEKGRFVVGAKAKLHGMDGGEAEIVVEPTRQQLASWMRDPSTILKGVVAGGKVHVFDSATDVGGHLIHDDVYHSLTGQYGLSDGAKIVITRHGENPPQVESYSGRRETHQAILDWGKRNFITVNRTSVRNQPGTVLNAEQERDELGRWTTDKYDGQLIHHFTTADAAKKVIESGHVRETDGLEGTAAYFTEHEKGTESRKNSNVKVSFKVQPGTKVVDLSTKPGEQDVNRWMHANATELERDSDDIASAMRRNGVDAIRLGRRGDTEHWWLVANPKKFKVHDPTTNSIGDRKESHVLADPADHDAAARDMLREVGEEYGRWLEQHRDEILQTTNADTFASHPEKIEAFQRWLKAQVGQLLTGQSQEQMWEVYCRQGYEKGAGRAFDDYTAARKRAPVNGPSGAAATPDDVASWYAGGRQQFLQDSFAQPVAVDRVKVLAGRSFDEMENVTTDMATKMSRALTDGLTQGKSIKDVAKDLRDVTDFSEQRANVVAATELIRSHAQGQLDSLKKMGAKTVGVSVEIADADDDRVCPICSELDGKVLDIDASYGVIPVHPRCRCCFMPSLPDWAMGGTKNVLTRNRGDRLPRGWILNEGGGDKTHITPPGPGGTSSERSQQQARDSHGRFAAAIEAVTDAMLNTKSTGHQDAIASVRKGVKAASAGNWQKAADHFEEAASTHELISRGSIEKGQHDFHQRIDHGNAARSAEIAADACLAMFPKKVHQEGSGFSSDWVKTEKGYTRRDYLPSDHPEYSALPHLQEKTAHLAKDMDRQLTNANPEGHNQYTKTRQQAKMSYQDHKAVVQQALMEGKEVPDRVLAQYPGMKEMVDAKLKEKANDGKDVDRPALDLVRGDGLRVGDVSSGRVDSVRAETSSGLSHDELGDRVNASFLKLEARPESSGMVSMLDLKHHSGLSRDDLHAGVNHLRRQGKLTGIAYEKRTPVKEEMDAGIKEGNGVIGYVARRVDNTDGITDVTDNAFCPTGPGGGIDPTCSPHTSPHAGGSHHTGSGLPINSVVTKRYQGNHYTFHVTPSGLQLMGHGTHVGSLPVGTVYASINQAANAIRGPGAARVSGWKFFDIPRTAAVGSVPGRQPGGAKKQPAPAPAPTPARIPSTPTPRASTSASLPSNIPFRPETKWETGKPQSGQVLNGVPFAPAPPKFWEKTPDVDVKEPKPLKNIDRVGIMIKEPDGRVWIVEPTNSFGNRNHTLPGGTVEKGLTDQQNALKEVWEETGLQVKITGHLGDFEDSNNGKNGRLYIGERIGGAPWDAKIESFIRSNKTGQPAAESESVKLVTPERASQLLHRTDDLAQLATVRPIDVDTNVKSNMMKKLVDGLGPKAREYDKKQAAKGITSGPGNGELHAVQELRGFNGKPTVVSKSDMDKLISSGTHIDLLRGVKSVGNFTGKDLADEFKSGDHFPGHGVFGSGTYTDSNRSGNVANSYSGYVGGAIIRMALPKTAKIIDQSELENKVPQAPPNWNGYGGWGPGQGGKDRHECWLGVQAALAGYDAIRVDGKSKRQGSYGKGFHVILNRSILVVQKEDAKGHVIK